VCSIATSIATPVLFLCFIFGCPCCPQETNLCGGCSPPPLPPLIHKTLVDFLQHLPILASQRAYRGFSKQFQAVGALKTLRPPSRHLQVWLPQCSRHSQLPEVMPHLGHFIEPAVARVVQPKGPPQQHREAGLKESPGIVSVKNMAPVSM